MTYRDRRAARAEQLRDFAGRREAKQPDLNEAARADEAATGIPFGQPILRGHHSQRRHERVIERLDRAMGASVENAQKAESMRTRAEEIERQADRAIYDDDPDAIERLQAKLATLEAKRESMKAANVAYRKDHREELKAMSAYERGQAVPYPSYAISNVGGVITTTRQRIARLSKPDPGRTLVAKYPGVCRGCGATIAQGDTLRYFRRTREVECVQCPD